MASPAPGVLVIGGGLAGALLALALREWGVAVTVVAAPPAISGSAGVQSATAISYGALPGWPLAPTALARLSAGASRRWRRLQRQHGHLGWRPRRLRLHGGVAGLEAASGWWPLPFAQVDAALLVAGLPRVLAAAGVGCESAWVERLEPHSAAGWELRLSNGTSLQAPQLVLAAGAHCRQLWPALPQALRSSWAAVLELAAYPASLAGPAAWLPAAFTRVALERRAAGLHRPEWLVDAGLVPWGQGALLGQHTLVRPGLELGTPPPPGEVDEQLRQGLAAQPWGVPLAPLPGQLRQAAVAFCSTGMPLVGPVPASPGLWVFTGFSAGFSQVPVLAPLLAQAMVSGSHLAAPATRRLRQLGVWLPDQARG
jgi:glycine/D-amino acid oxidase-like deaminating enzyme